jgi:hypothetical protein
VYECVCARGQRVCVWMPLFCSPGVRVSVGIRVQGSGFRVCMPLFPAAGVCLGVGIGVSVADRILVLVFLTVSRSECF